jgi:hypothetical protein
MAPQKQKPKSRTKLRSDIYAQWVQVFYKERI